MYRYAILAIHPWVGYTQHRQLSSMVVGSIQQEASMNEEDMDALRHAIIEGITSHLNDYDWDTAFKKFFGEGD